MFFSAYTTFTLILFLIWVLLYITQHQVRREMLILGILALFLLPLTFTVQAGDAVLTQKLFESLSLFDLLLSFSLAGIAGVAYHVFFGKHYHLLPSFSSKRNPKNSMAQFWVLRIFITLLVFVWLTLFFSVAFSFSTALAMLFSAIILALYIVGHRHDLLVDCLGSGLLTGLLTLSVAGFAGALFHTPIDIAFLAQTNYILGVPAELIIWSFALGLLLGPLYEFIRSRELQ